MIICIVIKFYLVLFLYSYYNIYVLQGEVCFMNGNPLKIKKRGEDGNRVISVRIKESTLEALDKIASQSNYSRNELINLILSHGIKNIELE